MQRSQEKIKENIARMEETDMAVVVSQGQNEIAGMNEKGLDIRPHRKRMVEEDLETRFKNPGDPSRRLSGPKTILPDRIWRSELTASKSANLMRDEPQLIVKIGELAGLTDDSYLPCIATINTHPICH
jgi:hypothetical protein